MTIQMYSLRLFMLTICNINDISELNQENIEIEKKFITSPADV